MSGLLPAQDDTYRAPEVSVVYNMSDKGYWVDIAPTGQNEYNSVDNGTGTLGAPRTVRLQMQVAL